MKLLAGILLLLGCLPPAYGQNPTQVHIYQAFTEKNSLNPNLIVAQRYNGTCSSRSLVIQGRNDTWQCQASNMTLDPCFQDDVYVVCTISPWSAKVAVLQPTTAIPKAPTQKVNIHREPWAVELKNGARCTFTSGASTLVNNLRANYSCNSYVYSIVGKIDRSSAVWKAKIYNFNRKQFEVMDIKSAWF